MADIPAPVNQTANRVDEMIRAAIFDVALEAYRAEAVALFPWLGWPVIGAIFKAFTGSVADRIYAQLAKYAVLQVIEAQTDQERANYKTAVVGLHVAEGSPDPQVRAMALERYKESLRRLIRYEGVGDAAK